jgi:hypothetical protein
MMGNRPDLAPRTNIALINFMERKVIEIAQENNFQGILTTNTNPLVSTLAVDVYGYEIMAKHHINKYVDNDGRKPFINAPDEQFVAVVFKSLPINDNQ